MTLYMKNILSFALLTRSISNKRNILLTQTCLLNKIEINRLVYENVRTIHSSCILFKRRKTAEERKLPKMIEYPPKAKGQLIGVWQNITVGELANVLQRDVDYVSDLFLGAISGKHTPITDLKELQIAIRRSGRRMHLIAKPSPVEEDLEKKDVFPRPPPAKSELQPRPPIVTIMGHVDHGKTTLLDALRHTNVVKQEFGGITQHIGAFSVQLKSGANVTFLDTPGHAAFSSMRERGANLTDIVVLVVAADDGVMEQTVESIRMATQAKVPILVAINKIDSPKSDIANTEKMLMLHGIHVENLGGDVQSVNISALKSTNLEQLTEALVLQAELMGIGGDPTGPVEAVVVESRVDTYRGRLCTIIVQRGTLKKGNVLVAGTSMAKVKLLKDAQGNILTSVGPGYPVEVDGWKDLPSAGDIVLQVESEKQARIVIHFRENKNKLEKQEDELVLIKAKQTMHEKEYKEKLQLKRRLGRLKLRDQNPTPETIKDDIGIPSLNVIIKSDVDGTLEAILDILNTYNYPNCKLDIISFGVGSITETDIELAETFKGVVYAFNVDCSTSLQKKAETVGVTINHHNVIYKLVDSIRDDINSRLPLKPVEYIIGEAKVMQQFLINEGRKKVPVAGCRCEKGILKKKSSYRIIRKESVIYEGTLTSMHYLKDEVDTIKTGSDCGLQFADKTVLFEVDDKIISYEIKMEPQYVEWNPGF